MKRIRVRKVDQKPVRNTGERSHPDPGEMFTRATTTSTGSNFVISPMQGLGSQTDLSWLFGMVEDEEQPEEPRARRRKGPAPEDKNETQRPPN